MLAEVFTFWSWLGLGTLLLILEVFGAGGYLLWIGLAAAAVGVLTFLLPSLPWEIQLLLFAVFSILTALYWWRRQRSVVRSSDQPNLNLRGQDMIGKVFPVSDAIVDGRGKIRVADGVWLVRGPETAVGERVRIIGQQGVVFLVEHVQ